MKPSDVLNVLKAYWPARAFAFNYSLHVSLCGSMDSMELVAYDKDHDLYHARSITYEELQAAPIRGFGTTAGVAISELCQAVREYEADFLRGYY